VSAGGECWTLERCDDVVRADDAELAVAFQQHLIIDVHVIHVLRQVVLHSSASTSLATSSSLHVTPHLHPHFRYITTLFFSFFSL